MRRFRRNGSRRLTKVRRNHSFTFQFFPRTAFSRLSCSTNLKLDLSFRQIESLIKSSCTAAIANNFSFDTEEQNLVDFSGLPIDSTAIQTLLGAGLQTEFTRTCIIFGLAAFVHAKQVRKEIKEQFSTLVTVIREDLDAQKSVLAALTTRVDKLESQYVIKSK